MKGRLGHFVAGLPIVVAVGVAIAVVMAIETMVGAIVVMTVTVVMTVVGLGRSGRAIVKSRVLRSESGGFLDSVDKLDSLGNIG